MAQSVITRVGDGLSTGRDGATQYDLSLIHI